MVKKSLLVLATALSVAGASNAQNKGCATDEVNRQARAAHPEIAEFEAQMEAQIAEGLKHIDLSRYAQKATGGTPGVINNTIPPEDQNTFLYHIPIVVHIVHDYGTENLSDDEIFEAVKEWNVIFAKQNADTADVIAPFKRYIGNPRIVLHLANKDKFGNPTKGIVRHQSYLSTNGGDQAKYEGWPNNAYINIWFVRAMPGHAGAAAYAYYPSAAQAPSLAPYDGVIALFDYTLANKSINHEIGHCLNLKHTWGDTNDPNVSCGDDGVDDTPPTKGHDGGGCIAANLYDTTCSNGYVKNYIVHDTETVVWNYPDTNNSQNIMDYTFCARMFSRGQVLRMHEALNLDVANRNNLWSNRNLAATGIIADSTKDVDVDALPRLELPPIPDFSVEKGKVTGVPPAERTFFGCASNTALQFGFTNRSWNDTITKVEWEFSNGAATPTVTSTGAGLNTTVNNVFSQPGWVTVTMKVDGNGGTHSEMSRQSVYVADNNPVVVDPNVAQYGMDFNPGQTDNWPIFNYYNNEFKWKLRNNGPGFLDNTCIQYTGFDSRPFPANATGTPGGDYDDFFSPAFDLTSMASGNCNLNFMSAGCFRTGNPADMKDSLIISYSNDCGKTWIKMGSLSKHQLANNGTLTIAYEPLWYGEWASHSFDIPVGARTAKTFFRFRYVPGVDGNQNSTGNNFYLDRINIGNFPLGLNMLVDNNHNVAVAPNPTTGNSYVVMSNIKGTAQINVTDVTGRLVYTTSRNLNGSIENVEIPASVLQVKGMYMVHVKTATQTYTEKLVSY